MKHLTSIGLGALFLLIVGIANAGSLSAEGGRFVFGQISDMARHQYMLDTKTGRLWVVVADASGSPCLQAVPYMIDRSRRNTLNAPTQEEELAEPVAEASPESYEALAKRYEDAGDKKMAELARAKACELRTQQEKK